MTDKYEPGAQKEVATQVYIMAVKDYLTGRGPDAWFDREDVARGAMKLYHIDQLCGGYPESDRVMKMFFEDPCPEGLVEHHPTSRRLYRLGAAGRKMIERWAGRATKGVLQALSATLEALQGLLVDWGDAGTRVERLSAAAAVRSAQTPTVAAWAQARSGPREDAGSGSQRV